MTIKTTLAKAAIVAVGAFGAFAFTPAPATHSSRMSDPIWFDSAGTNLGQRTQAAQQTRCGAPQVHCAYGYTSIDGQGNPVGNPVAETLKANN